MRRFVAHFNELGLSFTLASVVLGAGALLAGGIAPVSLADGVDGKAVFLAQKCNTCHSMSTVAIEAKTKTGKLAGGDLVGKSQAHEVVWLGKFLKGEEKLNGEVHKKKFTGTEAELDVLIQWLKQQKAP